MIEALFIMQVQSNQAIQSIPSSVSGSMPSHSLSLTQSSTSTIATSEASAQVSLSHQALQLAKADPVGSQSIEIQPVPRSTDPQTPFSGDKLEQAVQLKKAQLHYQVASDMVNLATGNSNNGLSLASTYYLSQNEDAREVVLNIKSEQQNRQNMQAYQEQTAALNEQYA